MENWRFRAICHLAFLADSMFGGVGEDGAFAVKLDHLALESFAGPFPFSEADSTQNTTFHFLMFITCY
jgi:hypothetical protein